MKKKAAILFVSCLFALIALAAFRVLQTQQHLGSVTAPMSLHMAAVSHPEGIDRLVSDGHSVNLLDDNGVTPLWLAVMLQKPVAVEKLLSHNADPNIAIEGQESPLTNAAKWGNLNTVQLLVDHGADVNSRYMSRTALHQAIIYGHDDIANLLLDQPGIDINQRERDTGYTPLHNAVQHERVDIITALLELDADQRTKDDAGNTPQDLADRKTNVAIAACFATGTQ